MTLNVELLGRVKAHILEEPKRFDMRLWGSPSDEAPCKTAACIGGWSLVLEKGVRVTDYNTLLWRNNHLICDPHDAARKVLGLTEDDADDLFYSSNWPIDLRDSYAAARDTENMIECARIAAERIDRFIVEHVTPIASAPAS